jgi:hypothetical protein
MIRVELSMSENRTGVTASVYIDQLSKKMVLVIVNTSWDIQKILLANTTNSTAVALTKFDVYTTSEQKNMQKQSVSSETLSIEPKSITTLVTDY